MEVAASSIIRLSKPHLKPAARMLVRAFQDDTEYTTFIPDEKQRMAKLPYLMEFLLRYGRRYGEVHVTSEALEGVAIWLPPEKKHWTAWRELRCGGMRVGVGVGLRNSARMMRVYRHIIPLAKRTAPFPHWYLLVLGVAPESQGRGYASRLLRPMLERIDAEHLPVYLETTTEANIAMYEHYGFEVREVLTVPGAELRIWSMVRGPPVLEP